MPMSGSGTRLDGRKGQWVSGLGVAAVLAVPCGALLFLYQFAHHGLSQSDLDRAFEAAFTKAVDQAIPSASGVVKGAELGAFLEPLLGFRPVALCEVGGFDFGGAASEQTRAAYQTIAGTGPLPDRLTAFQNAGNDQAAPDTKVIFHFISSVGAAHARSTHWNAPACQTGKSRCAPISEINLMRLGDGAVAFTHPSWATCPLHMKQR